MLIIGDFVVTDTLASSWIVLSSDSAASQDSTSYPLLWDLNNKDVPIEGCAIKVCSRFTETEDNMLHSEGGGLLGVCKENEFMDIHALDPRITKLLNPYFS